MVEDNILISVSSRLLRSSSLYPASVVVISRVGRCWTDSASGRQATATVCSRSDEALGVAEGIPYQWPTHWRKWASSGDSLLSHVCCFDFKLSQRNDFNFTVAEITPIFLLGRFPVVVSSLIFNRCRSEICSVENFIMAHYWLIRYQGTPMVYYTDLGLNDKGHTEMIQSLGV